MYNCIKNSFFICLLYVPVFLSAQFDTAVAGSLSKLSPQAKERLVKQYQIKQSKVATSVGPDTTPPNNSSSKKSYDGLASEDENLFEDLLEMEKIIKEAIISTELQLEDNTIDPQSHQEAENSLKKVKPYFED